MDSRDDLGGDVEKLEVKERDLEVLKSFDSEGGSSLAFQGLRRKLGFHPETLSRSLKRLERDSLLERTEDGYKLTDKGQTLLGSQKPEIEVRPLQIFQAYLPDPSVSRELEQRLRYRWFGGLRWLGSFSKRGNLVMSWITEDGTSQMNVSFSGGFVSVDAIVGDESMRERAIRSAYLLVSQIAKAYSSTFTEVHALLFQDYKAN